MQARCSHDEAQGGLSDQQIGAQPQLQVRGSDCRQAFALDLARCSKRTQAAASPPPFARNDSAAGPDDQFVDRSPGFALPEDKTITICVITGPSRGLTHRLTKPRISVGRTGGGADIEIDDAKVSGLHCAVGVRGDMVRLCDLDSANGTYIDGERVHAAQLEHLSEFRVGSSLLLVTILPKSEMGTS